MLIPRKGAAGITFLRPDKALLKDIQDMASGDEPESAIEALQSLVLLDNISSIGEFDDKKSDIPTYLRKKLQVVSADGKKVILKNGAEIVPDKDFQARKDRGNISVYIISKALVPADGPDADFSNAVAKEKKGGADLGANRQSLFENVLHSFCVTDRDSAMELLVAMHGWAKATGANGVAKAIEAKASFDTLATLAIILQPYSPSVSPYIGDEDLDAFRTAMYMDKNFQSDTHAYSRNEKCNNDYSVLASGDSESQKDSKMTEKVQVHSTKLAAKMGKLNAVRLLNDYYNVECQELCSGVSALRLFAEAELRVLSAMVLENSSGRFDEDELLAIYRNCKLDKPYMCNDKDLIQSSNLGFYYSTVYLIARSDALFYVPSLAGSDTSAISGDTVFIGLNLAMKNMLNNKREKSQESIVNESNVKY